MTEQELRASQQKVKAIRAYQRLKERIGRADDLGSSVEALRRDIFKAAVLAYENATGKELDPLLCTEFAVSLESDCLSDLGTQLGFLKPPVVPSQAERDGALASVRDQGQRAAALRALMPDAPLSGHEHENLSALPAYLAEIDTFLRGWIESGRVIERWAPEREEHAFRIRTAFLNVVTTPIFGAGGAFEKRGEDVYPRLFEDGSHQGSWSLVERAKRTAAFRFWDYLRGGGKPPIGYCAYHRCGKPFLIGRKKQFCSPKCTRASSAAASHKRESIERYQGLFPDVLCKVQRWARTPALRRQNKSWKRYLVGETADLKPKLLTELERDVQIADKNEMARRFLRRLSSDVSQPLPEHRKLVSDLIAALLRAIELQKDLEAENAQG